MSVDTCGERGAGGARGGREGAAVCEAGTVGTVILNKCNGLISTVILSPSLKLGRNSF
jgi:hypothetical protein